MQFLIRADASLQIGSGHIMRCLTLAHKLRQQHHRITFITRAHQGHLADTIRQQGFDCILLPLPSSETPFAPSQRQPENECNEFRRSQNEQSEFRRSQIECNEFPQNHPTPPHAAWLATTQTQDLADCAPHIHALAPDWIICDHYALSAPWQTAARAISHSKIMVIDDLHDRPHDADLLLDQNHAHTARDYTPLVPPSCHILAGTRYALLRDEFAQHRATSLHQRAESQLRQPETALPQNPNTQTILINLGGVDKDNHTLAVLQALSDYVSGSLKTHSHQPPPIRATIIIGATAPHLASVQRYAATAPYPGQVIANAHNMAELMTQATWAIGAAGSTSWERCALGLPTLLLTIADNQRPIAAQLQRAGAALALEASQIHSPAFQAALAHLMQPENQHRLSQAAARLCDAHGAERVARHLARLATAPQANLRPATAADCDRIHAWRNHPSIRRMMFNPDPIPLPQHQTWFAAQLTNPNFKIYVYTLNGTPQGYGSLKRIAPNEYEWGFYLAPNCPRGNGSILCTLLLQRAFGELGASTVHGQALRHNAASIALHRKLGFRQPENSLHDDHIVPFILSAEQSWQ